MLVEHSTHRVPIAETLASFLYIGILKFDEFYLLPEHLLQMMTLFLQSDMIAKFYPSSEFHSFLFYLSNLNNVIFLSLLSKNLHFFT